MTSTSSHMDQEGDWHHVEEDQRRRRRYAESESHTETARQIPTVFGPATSSTFAETAGKNLDLKGLLRPPSFTGLKKDWPEWKFRVDNVWMILGIDQLMKWCVTATDLDLDPAILEESQAAVNRFVYGVLVQLCSGKALVTIRLVAARDGLRAWKRLVTTYEPAMAMRWNAMLSGIQNPQWTDEGDFQVQLLEWERKIEKYVSVVGALVPSNFKCATVMRWAPAAVREYLHRAPIDVMSSYSVLRSQLTLYFTKARNITTSGEASGSLEAPAPVLSTLQEVLATLKGKFKGDSKGKSKGDSK